jgi:hypothetical protein
MLDLQSKLNEWFLGLPEGRQKALLDGDRWMLAGAAFEAGAALTSAPAEPNDEAVEDFLATRMTAEGRVPMVQTIKEALKHFAAPPAAGAIDAREQEAKS